MNKYKTLAGNTLIFGVCNFTSKLLVFFMLPFYTSVLSKEEFGTADMINTTVGLMLPILTLGVAHGCMRFALDKTKDVKKVFSFGVKVLVIGFLVLLLALPLVKKIPVVCDYIFYFIVLFAVHTAQQFLSLFARGINRVKLVGISGIVGSFVAVLSNVVLMFVFRFGVYGYIISMIISQFVAVLILFLGGKMYQLFSRESDRTLSKEIMLYSVPMVPNTLSWWINHSVNRYILNSYCGIADVGLYSAASKMPTMINTFRGIFVEAWQLSTITEYDKKDSSSFFNNIYKVYNTFLILLCSLLIVLSQLIAKVLYSKDFFEAWEYTPILLLGMLFGSLIAFYSPTYLAYKKTNKLFISTFLGAVITIVFNFIMVPKIGILGAAITSVISNFTIYMYLKIDSKKYVKFDINSIKYYISYLILTIQVVLITFVHIQPHGLISIGIFFVLFVINFAEFEKLSNVIVSFVINKIRKNR